MAFTASQDFAAGFSIEKSASALVGRPFPSWKMGIKNIFIKKLTTSRVQVSQYEFSDPAGAIDVKGYNSSVPETLESHSQVLLVSDVKAPASKAVVSTPSLSRQNSSTSSTGSNSSSKPHSVDCPYRIVNLANSNHCHQLKNARRQEKLGRMLREFMGSGQKVDRNAVSAVPDFVKQADRLTLMHGLVDRLANGEVEVGRVSGASHQPKRLAQSYEGDESSIKETTATSLYEKYGRCQEVIGRGSYGVVRISHKTGANGKEQLFAVKEFRKRNSESVNVYQDRLMSEFCISSSLDHINIIHTFDLMKDAHGSCCQIMEYCSGGDLYSLIISSGAGLSAVEADCFMKQMLRGVVYMHSMGVAHCDLKPENILLTQNGVVKISDFGNGECFRMAWEKDVHYSKGVFGSGPYIAPEEFKGKFFDPRAVDIWALGVIYMVMRTGSYLWRKAICEEDDHYARYIRDRKTAQGFAPVEKLTPSKSVYVIYSILDPVPSRRITGKQILNSEWGRSIRVCESAELKEKPQSSTQSCPVRNESEMPEIPGEKMNKLILQHQAQEVRSLV